MAKKTQLVMQTMPDGSWTVTAEPPQASKAEALGSSAWVAELEAALRSIRAVRTAIVDKHGDAADLGEAIRLIAQRIHTERSRSATVVFSDGLK